MKIFAKIRYFQLIISTMFYVSIYIIIILFNKKYVVRARKWVSKRILKANNIKIHNTGINIDLKAKLFIVNHQNMLDIMILEALIPMDICWIAKRELFKIPFFGLAVKIPQMIALDRSSKTGLKTLINITKNRIARNRSIVIFPEGTRSKTSNFNSFKLGAQFIANKLDLIVQPIVISNTKKLLRSQYKELYPNTIIIKSLISFKANKASKNWLQEEKTNMQTVYNDISK